MFPKAFDFFPKVNKNIFSQAFQPKSTIN